MKRCPTRNCYPQLHGWSYPDPSFNRQQDSQHHHDVQPVEARQFANHTKVKGADTINGEDYQIIIDLGTQKVRHVLFCGPSAKPLTDVTGTQIMCLLEKCNST
jgi:hypothetical protein